MIYLEYDFSKTKALKSTHDGLWEVSTHAPRITAALILAATHRGI